jgi:hypothetical protein
MVFFVCICRNGVRLSLLIVEPQKFLLYQHCSSNNCQENRSAQRETFLISTLVCHLLHTDYSGTELRPSLRESYD